MSTEPIDCPRANSSMTPCILRDGAICLADDGVCVGCGADPTDLLEQLRHATTGRKGDRVVIPRHAADKLAALAARSNGDT